MAIAYLDCFSGIAGDMLLAAALDAGCPLAYLQDIVGRLQLPGVTLTAEKTKRHSLACTYVNVLVPDDGNKKHRHLKHILAIIDAASLDVAVAERARAVFTRLAEAEASVHATTVEKVHFHEVGAADAIVDIVCGCAALRQLGVEQVICSPIPTGHGSVNCEHGLMPVPAPATANLLRGVPLAACEEPGELTTPTGAALATTLASGFGPLPEMQIRAVGYGAGSRDGKTRPNVFRLLIGDSLHEGACESDTVVVLEAQFDDATGQALAFACERLLEAGALDAFLTPIIMKKGRPGCLLVALAAPADAARIEAQILRETTTLGVRRHEARRSKLAREFVPVTTEFGPIRMKVGRRGGEVWHAWPEYEDCAAAARAKNVPILSVQQAAQLAWQQRRDG